MSVYFSLQNSKNNFFPCRWHPQHPLCGAPCPHRLEPPKNTVLLRTTRTARRVYTLYIPGSGEQVAPGAETTGQTQCVNILGTPFALEGLFGEADAEAMDAEPDSELATGAIGMDVEDDAADRGMIVDDDGAANNTHYACSIQPNPSS